MLIVDLRVSSECGIKDWLCEDTEGQRDYRNGEDE
jgi:hypothetical protein